MPHYRPRKDEAKIDRLVVPLTLTERARVKWLAERLECSEAEVARRAMRELGERQGLVPPALGHERDLPVTL